MSKSTTGSSRQARPTTKNQSTKPGTKRPPGAAAKKRPAGGRATTATKRPASSRGARQAPRSGAAPGRRAPARASFRSRHPVLTALVPVAIVVAVIATMVLIKATGGSSPGASHPATSADTGTTALPRQRPGGAVGADGDARRGGQPGVGRPAHRHRWQRGDPAGSATASPLSPTSVRSTARTARPSAGPWPWPCRGSGPSRTCRGPTRRAADVYPNTQTLSFYGSSYSSPYVDFQPVEEATNQQVGGTYQTLQTPTAAQSSLMSTYDSAGSIPFLDIANKYVITGASYSPQVLQGLSREQIAAQLSDSVEPRGAGDRRDGQRHHGRHLQRHRQPAEQRVRHPGDRGDRQEAGGVTMAVARRPSDRATRPGTDVGGGRLARPVAGGGGHRLVPDRGPLQRPRRAGLPGHRDRELHAWSPPVPGR